MSFTSNEKSYGGYSSFSPMRHAEKSSDKKERNKNVPAYVHDKVEEIMKGQKEKDEGKAWAVAWSIYCKYKKPGASSCKKETSDYFPSRKAAWSKQELNEIRRITLRINGKLDQLVSSGLIHITQIINQHTTTEREREIIWYMFTYGKFPTYMFNISKEARILGKISGLIHHEKRVKDITYQEEKVAYKVLYKICKYCHVYWSSKVWSKVWVASGDYPIRTIRVEFLTLHNVKFNVEYTRLLRHLFDS
jgi:hypothetical protein